MDDCVGALDACGVCNGPGEIYEAVVRTSLKATATAMETSSTLLKCGGDCAEDADADGICDDVDDCVGALDACGVQRSRRDLRVRMCGHP